MAAILKTDRPAARKIESLREIDEGRMWLDNMDEVKDPWFMVSCGSGWFHYEGSWIDKLDVPFSYIKGYIERLDKGERIERSLATIAAEREAMGIPESGPSPARAPRRRLARRPRPTSSSGSF